MIQDKKLLIYLMIDYAKIRSEAIYGAKQYETKQDKTKQDEKGQKAARHNS